MSTFLSLVRDARCLLAVSLPLSLCAFACGSSTSSNAPSGDGGNGDVASSGAPSGGGKGAIDGGSADSKTPGVPGPNDPPALQSCPSVTEDICRRAAACSGAGTLVLAHMVQDQVVATEEHLTESECATYYRVLGCSELDVDLDACADALTTSACITTKKGEALAMPQACSKPNP